jgi:hypothetical protein
MQKRGVSDAVCDAVFRIGVRNRLLSGWKSALAHTVDGTGPLAHLRRAGMRREFIQEVGGVSRRKR